MQFENSYNIRIYKDVFLPPEGYEIEWVEMTTWSLAKDWLRMIAAMIAAGNSGFVKDTLTRPNSFIKANSDKTPRFHVFYDGNYQLEQEGGIYCQTANGRFSAYLFEQCCSPVKIKGLFHPKLILLQFKSRDAKKNGDRSLCFRMYVSSRNLTWSNYVEAGVLLESDGIINEPGNNDSPGPAMARFLEKYYKEVKKELPEQLAMEVLKKTQFHVVTPKKEIVDKNPKLYFGKEKELLGLMKSSFSTFGKEPGWNYFLRVSSMRPDKELLKEYSCQYICNFKDMYDNPKGDNKWVRKKGMENAWYLTECTNDNKQNPNTMFGEKPIPLHVKQYVFFGISGSENNMSYSNTLTWMGSANCSKNGLNKKNEEAMVCFSANRDDSSFPCTGPRGAQFGKRNIRVPQTMQIPCMQFRHYKNVIDPVLPSIEEEEGVEHVRINVLASASYDEEKKKMTVLLSNQENQPVMVWPATCSEADFAQKVNASQTMFLEFSLTKSRFSRLLHIRREEEETVYSILLELKCSNGQIDTMWYGKNYSENKKVLPTDPFNELGDLIPKQSFFSWNDNVYEKMLKCKINMEEKEFKQFANTVRGLFETEKKACDLMGLDEEDDVDDEAQANIIRLFERENEVNEFRELLKKLGGEEEDGTDRTAKND